MSYKTLFVIFTLVLTSTPVECQCDRKSGGHWAAPEKAPGYGTWGPLDCCDNGGFGIGFGLKVEENQGSIGHVWGGSDDTALNGISMVCSNDSNVHTSTVGPFGEWRMWHLCLKAGHYLVSAQVRDEKIDYYHVNIEDNTATNNIVMYCKKWGTKTAIKLTGNGLSWGKYGLPRICKEGFAICGLRTKVYRKQGKHDDYGMVGVQFYCCKV